MRAVKVAKETDQLHRRFISKAVIDRLGVPARRDDPFRAKLCKMLGKRALAQIHILPEFADRLLSVAQAAQDRQSLLAREEFKEMRGVARTRLERLDRRRWRAFLWPLPTRGFRFDRSHRYIFVYSEIRVNPPSAARGIFSSIGGLDGFGDVGAHHQRKIIVAAAIPLIAASAMLFMRYRRTVTSRKRTGIER